jgi:hypothetical protein
MAMLERDQVKKEIVAKSQMKSVGIEMEKTRTGIKFVYENKQIIADLEHLGFSLDILKVQGGEMPLPELAVHVDEQASLESYWSAIAEKSRYELMLEQDKFNWWFESKYSKCFNELQMNGVPKPIQKEVEARISFKYKDILNKKRKRLRDAEYKYRILCNACHASLVTKGKMLQTLRNIIQGGNSKMPITDVPTIETETKTIKELDITSLRIGG